jgi:adenylate cyclase class IV
MNDLYKENYKHWRKKLKKTTEDRKISIVYKHHIFLIHLSVVGHLGCFHNLAIVNSTTINMGVQVPLE